MDASYIVITAILSAVVLFFYLLVKFICRPTTRAKIGRAFKTGKAWLYIFVFILGTVFAFSAALFGGVGPETPTTGFGQFISFIYGPYFAVFCEPLDAVGFLIAIILHGVICAVLLGFFLKAINKIRSDRALQKDG